jgi:hypothetical protein
MRSLVEMRCSIPIDSRHCIDRQFWKLWRQSYMSRSGESSKLRTIINVFEADQLQLDYQVSRQFFQLGEFPYLSRF